MKKVLIIIAVIFSGCQQKDWFPDKKETVVYITDCPDKTDTVVVDVDFDVEKDKWFNDIMNNEKFVRTKDVDGILNKYVLEFPSVRRWAYEYVGTKVFNMYARNVELEDVLFQRDNRFLEHRVSAITEARIKSLLAKGK